MVRKAIQVRESLLNRVGGVFLPEHGWFLASKSHQPLLVNRAMLFRRQGASSDRSQTWEAAHPVFSLFKSRFSSGAASWAAL